MSYFIFCTNEMAAIMDGYHHIPVRLLAIYRMKKYALYYTSTYLVWHLLLIKYVIYFLFMSTRSCLKYIFQNKNGPSYQGFASNKLFFE